MVYIRTDANEKIATGHVMRCLTIAEEIIQLGEMVHFFVSDEESAILIHDRKYQVTVLHTKWDKVDSEYEYGVLKAYAHKGDVLLVDSYSINTNYLSKMKKIFKVATFDDLFLEKKTADIIINYNIFYTRFNYKECYENEACKLLLGERYVPLREQFKITKPYEKIQDIDFPTALLMCGGGDTQNMIYKCLRWIKQTNSELFTKIEWKVVIGAYYPHREELECLVNENKNIQLLVNVKNMASLMRKCDLCITAASTVLYECCAMQLPTMFVVVAEDQMFDAQCFSKDGMMIYCGDFVKKPIQTLENVENDLKCIAFNKTIRQNMKRKMKNLVDGYGAKRIAEALIGGNDSE